MLDLQYLTGAYDMYNFNWIRFLYLISLQALGFQHEANDRAVLYKKLMQ